MRVLAEQGLQTKFDANTNSGIIKSPAKHQKTWQLTTPAHEAYRSRG